MPIRVPSFLLVVVLALPAAAGERCEDRLPDGLRGALAAEATTTAVHLDWPGFRRLPVIDRALELNSDGYPTGAFDAMAAFGTSRVEQLGLSYRDISDVWIVGTSGSLLYGASLWVRVDLDDRQLGSELEGGGWTDLGDGSFGLLPDGEEVLMFEAHIAEIAGESDLDEVDIESFREMLMEPRATAVLAGDGWLRLGARSDGGAGEPGDLGFPMANVCELGSSTIVAVAIDLDREPNPPDEAETPEDPTEARIAELRRRIAVLEKRTQGFSDAIQADYLITVQDLDGGLGFDVVARSSHEGSEEQIAEFLEMVLLGARVMVGADRDLADQLASVLVRPGEGEVSMNGVVSQNTLIEAVEFRSGVREELSELYTELGELRAEQERGSTDG